MNSTADYKKNFMDGINVIHQQGDIVYGVSSNDYTNTNATQGFNSIGIFHQATDLHVVVSEFKNVSTGQLEFAFVRIGLKEDGGNIQINHLGQITFNLLPVYPDEATAQADVTFPQNGVYRVGTDLKIKL